MDPPPPLTICLAGWRARPPHPGQLSITYPSACPPVPHCPPCPGTFKPSNPRTIDECQHEYDPDQTRMSLTLLFILSTTFDSQRRANCPNFRRVSLLAFPAHCHTSCITIHRGGEDASNLPRSPMPTFQSKGAGAGGQHELLQFPKLSCRQPTLLPIMHPSTPVN